MGQYYKVYMQKEQDGGALKETIADFGMYCMDIPFAIGGSAKSLTERSWADEDGKDVYIPETIMIEAYTMTVKFGFKGDKFSANENITNMVNYLTGRDGSGVYLKMYCDYTKIGRKHVRFVKLSDEAELVRNDEDGDILVIEMQFSVDDPATAVTTEEKNGTITGLA